MWNEILGALAIMGMVLIGMLVVLTGMAVVLATPELVDTMRDRIIHRDTRVLADDVEQAPAANSAQLTDEAPAVPSEPVTDPHTARDTASAAKPVTTYAPTQRAA